MRFSPVLIVLVLVGGCARRSGPSGDFVRPVKVTTASGAGYVRRDFVGMATPDDAVTLAFKLSGQVLDVPVSQGQSVGRGALLAELDSRDIELKVSADRSAYREADSQMQRMQRLLAHEAVSRQDAEASRTRYAQARATYENTLDLLQDTRLKAPFAGVIEAVYVDNYERVQSGQPILRLVDPRTTTVKFTLPESALASLADASTRFTVEFDNYRAHPFLAHLKEYAKTSSDASGFPVSLTLDDVDTLLYRISPGMSCTITMFTVDSQPDAVTLPVSAVYAPIGDGTFVWVVDSDRRVRCREVGLGELYGRDRVIVREGLRAGEQVVTAGVYQLKQGDQVRILK